jgi:hypothetical protein
MESVAQKSRLNTICRPKTNFFRKREYDPASASIEDQNQPARQYIFLSGDSISLTLNFPF